LKEAIEMEELNELERNGLIQRFEYTIELAWKVLKDYFEFQGFEFKSSPKETIRLAQQSGYIEVAQELIDGLDMINVLSHDYNGKKFNRLEKSLRGNVYPALVRLHEFFEKEGGYE
jgi:nucleotidyltransferase substrate binding protein (TIGR01987 family)